MTKKKKYTKTKYPNIYWYETTKGKRYYIRRSYQLHGKKKEATKSNLKNVAEARAALAEIERMIENNEFAYNKNMTVDQYWNIYYDNRIKTGRWAPDTEANKVSIYNNHFKGWLGNVKMRDINRLDYENSINGWLLKYSRETVRQSHGILNAMLNDAVNNKYLDDNPINKIYIGKSKISPRDNRISLEEFKVWDAKAREIIDEYEYTMIRITYLGPRKSEDYGIQIGNLNKLENGRYMIKLKDSRTKRRPDGGRMKTKGSERVLIADEETSFYLDKAISKTYAIAKKYGRILGPKDYLFIADYPCCKNSSKGKPIPLSRLNSLFNKVSEACGIHITPHKMRHFFATQGQIAGISIEHMAAALGHSTSYMTQKYTHIADEVSSAVTDTFIEAIK